MNHMEFAALESAALEPTAWELFAYECERLCAGFIRKDFFGKPSLDGDQDVDGYSIDWLYSQWEAGKTPTEVHDDLKGQLAPH